MVHFCADYSLIAKSHLSGCNLEVLREQQSNAEMKTVKVT
jgi:hypothetical protein